MGGEHGCATHLGHEGAKQADADPPPPAPEPVGGERGGGGCEDGGAGEREAGRAAPLLDRHPRPRRRCGLGRRVRRVHCSLGGASPGLGRLTWDWDSSPPPIRRWLGARRGRRRPAWPLGVDLVLEALAGMRYSQFYHSSHSIVNLASSQTIEIDGSDECYSIMNLLQCYKQYFLKSVTVPYIWMNLFRIIKNGRLRLFSTVHP
jgi:hypothetical protein